MNGRMVIGWLIVAGFLLVMADIPATADLAVAFAYLILITAFLTGGFDAMQNLASLLNRNTTEVKA
jgi:hypothetical protein